MRRSFYTLLITIVFISVANAQQQSVSGTVRDAVTDQPLASITVQVKGAEQATATDDKGNYSFNAIAPSATLIFSAVGFRTQEIPVRNRKEILVSLVAQEGNLDEVIVVAYGTANKGTFTGAASVVNADKIKDVPTTSFENALNGRVPGLQVTQSSGQAGSTSSIRIRGIGSMNASNEPLYVIDGVPVVSGSGGQLGDYILTSNNIMNTLNPADIESVTVLKDAAASSLYGSRAANGVVVITTKRGKIGKPVISLKSSIGITPIWATDNYEVADVQEQVNMLYQVFHDLNTSGGKTDAAANTNALSRLNSRFNPHGYFFETNGPGRYENVIIKGMTDGVENREGKYYDWDDVLFRTGIYNTNDLSVSGGTDKTTYYSSLSYTKDQNRIAVNEFERISGRLNFNQKIGKYLELMSNVNITKDDKSGFNDSRNLGNNYFLQSRNLLWPLYWPTDYKTGQPFTARYGSYAYNEQYYKNEWENNSGTLNVGAVEALTVKILPELNIKSVFSYNNSQIKDHLYYSANHFEAQTTKGAVHEITTNINKMISSTTANYNKDFGLHNLGILAGFEAEKNLTDFMRASGVDIPNSSLHTVATAGKTTSNAYSWGNNMMSAFSRAEYNFDQKYYASASYRRDGSSRLGPKNRWGDFWSVAGSWRLNKEAFLKDVAALSNLRLRASYGINGTLPIDNFGWRNLVTYSTKYMEQAGGIRSTIADENLTWETSYSTNIALEFGLFDQRVFGTVEYFNKNSKNLLQDVLIATVTGFSSILRNVGEINNHGVEVELGGDIIRKSKLRWSASVNGTFLKSAVTKLYSPDGTVGQDIIWYDPTGNDTRAQYIYREGESTLAFYGYEWAGVEPTTGKNVWFVNDVNDNTKGEFLFKGRGATYDYGNANRKILGNGIPDLFGGFNTDVEYTGITLGLNFIYKLGGNLYDGAYKDVADDGYYWERTRSAYYYEHMWTDNNTSGTLPKLSGNDLTDPMQYSTRQMHNASFLRLKNITLGYNIPVDIIEKVGLSNARVYFNGSNLLTFSKYKIADPEVNQYATRGWETPFGKTYTFGLEISF